MNDSEEKILYPTSILFVLKEYIENLSDYNDWNDTSEKNTIGDIMQFNFDKEWWKLEFKKFNFIKKKKNVFSFKYKIKIFIFFLFNLTSSKNYNK